MKGFATKTSEALSESQRAALISLLADEDPAVHQTVRTKLITFGTTVLEWLRPYTLSDEPLLRRRAQEIINFFGRKTADDRFMAFCASRGEDLPLEEGAWLLARTQYPDINIGAYEALLDAFASVLYERINFTADVEHIVGTVNHYLFQELEFTPNEANYYDPDNSFLNRVIDDREGIPITLSVLFLELGRKLEIEKLDGMPFPGHFMVRFTEPDKDPIYIDVFDGGKLYQKNQLYSLIANHSEVPLLDEHFKPATKRDIILRILKNLIAVSMQQDDPSRTLPYLDLSLAVSPDQPLDRWRRATLLLQSGRQSLAREDLKWLLDRKAEGFDLDRIEDLYRKLEKP